MAKRIKFPLEMKDGVKVRSLEELQEHFDMEKVLEYYFSSDKKLQRWLENYYYDDLLEEVEKLSGEEENLAELLGSILGVDKEKCVLDVSELKWKTQTRETLKLYGREDLAEHLEQVADTQERLQKLVEKGCKKVYLLKNSYTITKNMQGIEIEGVGEPEIEIEAQDIQDFSRQNVRMKKISYANEECRKKASCNPVITGVMGITEFCSTLLQLIEVKEEKQ